MTNKEKYQDFCKKTYVPIWSKPWWMDAVCGSENWDVWLYEDGGNIWGAMPYYMETRGKYRYITKATQTQNNGIIFRYNSNSSAIAKEKLREKIIREACHYLDSLGIDVYEQQYHHSFQNWTPFYWHNFTNIVRYTYVLEELQSKEDAWNRISSNYRNVIRKGERLIHVTSEITLDKFYAAYQTIFRRKNMKVPISEEFLQRVYQSATEHNSCKMLCARDEAQNIHSILFLVWDEQAVYHLFGGYVQEYAKTQSYPVLTWYGIQFAIEQGLSYDFEGSMIDGVAQAMRQFGGEPKPYYRIRKVYNPDIVRKEAEDYIARLAREQEEKEGT